MAAIDLVMLLPFNILPPACQKRNIEAGGLCVRAAVMFSFSLAARQRTITTGDNTRGSRLSANQIDPALNKDAAGFSNSHHHHEPGADPPLPV